MSDGVVQWRTQTVRSPQPDAPAQPGGLGSQHDAPTQPAQEPGGLGGQPAASQPTAPVPGRIEPVEQPLGGAEGGLLAKTLMIDLDVWGPVPPPPAGEQPFSQQAVAQGPFPGAPFPGAPFPQPPLVAQPYAPALAAVPQAARPQKMSSLVVFVLSAIAVFLLSGAGVGVVVLYLLFNR